MTVTLLIIRRRGAMCCLSLLSVSLSSSYQWLHRHNYFTSHYITVLLSFFKKAFNYINNSALHATSYFWGLKVSPKIQDKHCDSLLVSTNTFICVFSLFLTLLFKTRWSLVTQCRAAYQEEASCETCCDFWLACREAVHVGKLHSQTKHTNIWYPHKLLRMYH